MKLLFGKIGLGVATLMLLAGGWGISHPVMAQNPKPAMSHSKMAGNHAAMMMKMMLNRPKSMKQADAAIQKVKMAAMKKGMYNCCLKHPCDWCALKMGACPCGKNAAKGMPVCNECKGGWEAGDGAIPGLTADQIKTFPCKDMMPMGKMGKKMGAVPVAATKLVVVNTCPITGGKVVGQGAGVSVVGNYEVHFCCAGCNPIFDKMSKAQQLAKVRAVI